MRRRALVVLFLQFYIVSPMPNHHSQSSKSTSIGSTPARLPTQPPSSISASITTGSGVPDTATSSTSEATGFNVSTSLLSSTETSLLGITQPESSSSTMSPETTTSIPSSGIATSSAQDINSNFTPSRSLPPVSTSIPPASAPSSSTSTSGSPSNILASTKSNKTSSIAAGVVVPIVALALAAAAVVLFKRRRRARDRLEWERTHKEIADAVRKAGAAGTTGSAASGSGWSRMELVSRPASGTDGQASMRGVLGGDSMDRPFSDYTAPPLPASWRGPEYSAAADVSPPESPEPGFYRDEPEPEPELEPESRPASPTGSAVHVDSSIGHRASAV
ncbi:hypothetical protein GGX14DRAFT_450653 [Mycena pura]|uniref:Uncharacterized protein n=1 Tax=Mycena pura TaxID=153505 RepID=A0AAD6YFE6_9AGAR|nr:hypothetical protein GGX14DRAFT_450653 [Mycena pura]